MMAIIANKNSSNNMTEAMAVLGMGYLKKRIIACEKMGRSGLGDNFLAHY